MSLTSDERNFLLAVRRFIEAEYVHAKAISDHMDKGGKDMQDWPHSRDDVDLAHANLMNFPAILCDVIALKLGGSLNEDPTLYPEGPET